MNACANNRRAEACDCWDGVQAVFTLQDYVATLLVARPGTFLFSSLACEHHGSGAIICPRAQGTQRRTLLEAVDFCAKHLARETLH